jgi:hypothetical protein
MKIKYKDIRFQQRSLELIGKVNEVIDDLAGRGFTPTLRQLYYRLVASCIIANSKNSYNNLGTLCKNGRMTGLIDWRGIEDRGRGLCGFSYYAGPRDFFEKTIPRYKTDPWKNQKYYLEVWCEKQALENIVEEAAGKYDVDFLSCKGFPSTSELWRASFRFIGQSEAGKQNVLIYLGDHDPSGCDIDRDIGSRLAEFGAEVKVERIALTKRQTEQYGLPPQPAKKQDRRTAKYEEEHGSDAWELDALGPDVLDGLISETVEKYIDWEEHGLAKKRDEEERECLYDMCSRMF